MLERLDKNAATLSRMAKVGAPVAADAVPPGSAQIVVSGVTIAFPLEGAIDLDAERARLSKASPRPKRIATASPRGSPTRPSPSGPSPRRSKRPAPTMTREPREAERLSAALARLG